MKKVLIIGGGFGGCTSAHMLSQKTNYEITLIEASPFLGGGCRTKWYGGHPHTFGPRHFLTQNENTFNFLNKYLPLRRCNNHIFLSYVESDQEFFNFPIHKDDIPKMKESKGIQKELNEISTDKINEAKNLKDYWKASVGETLFNKFIDKYTRKMWKIEDCSEFDEFTWSQKGVTLKEGNKAAWDIAISAYPYAPDGYNQYFKIATSATNVKVCLNTKIEAFDIPNKTILVKGEKQKFDFIINTISPDILFDFCYGELPYIGREVQHLVLPGESIFPKDVYFLYYTGDEKFTRLVEYKKFTHHKSNTSLIGIEYPSKNGRYYPLPIKKYQRLAQKYYNLMPDGVFSIGRAGSYKYLVDIDDCIEQSMDITNMIVTGSREGKAIHPVRQSLYNTQ